MINVVSSDEDDDGRKRATRNEDDIQWIEPDVRMNI